MVSLKRRQLRYAGCAELHGSDPVVFGGTICIDGVNTEEDGGWTTGQMSQHVSDRNAWEDGMERLSIEDVKRVDGYGLVIRLSDETMMRFTVEELVNMRPVREKTANEEA